MRYAASSPRSASSSCPSTRPRTNEVLQLKTSPDSAAFQANDSCTGNTDLHHQPLPYTTVLFAGNQCGCRRLSWSAHLLAGPWTRVLTARADHGICHSVVGSLLLIYPETARAGELVDGLALVVGVSSVAVAP